MRQLTSFVVLAMAAPLLHGQPHGSSPDLHLIRPDQIQFARGACPQAEENCFAATAAGSTLYFHPGTPGVEIVRSAASNDTPMAIGLSGAQAQASLSGTQQLPGVFNLIGSDPAHSRLNVPTFAAIEYKGVYAKTDLVFYGAKGHLEYDFRLQPDADPSRIVLNVSGTRDVRLESDGSLTLGSPLQSSHFSKPVAYQTASDGTRLPVTAAYRVQGNRIGFALGPWNHSLPLTIDPVLTWSTNVGTSYTDRFGLVATDASGNLYLAGTSSNLAIVEKLTADGKTVVYRTVIGSGYSSTVERIQVDAAGQAYLAGYAGPGFPTTSGAYQKTVPSGNHAFLAVMNAAGNALTYATYLAGASTDVAYDLALDGSKNCYLTGTTSSANFPVTGSAFQKTLTSSSGSFVAKINPALSGTASLVYSTYLTGTNPSYLYGIAVDPSGDAYVTGYAYADYPTTPGAFLYKGYGTGDLTVVVTKLNAAGSALSYSSLLGPGQGSAIAVDASGDAYVTGTTSVYDFPTTAGAWQTADPGAFAALYNAAGSALTYSTFLGGPSAGIVPESITIAPGCKAPCSAVIAGYTSSSDLPLANPIQNFNAGSYDYFITELNATGTAAALSTYLGGSGSEYPYEFAHSPSVATIGSDIVLSGLSTSTADFPLTLTGTPTYSFVARIGAAASASALPQPSSLTFTSEAVNVTSAPSPITLRNVGGSALSISSIKTTGDYAQSNTCGSSLAPGATCTINVTFTATLSGTRVGSVIIASNGVNPTVTIPLTGTGVDAPLLLLSTNNIAFGDQIVESASPAQTVTVTNKGDRTLSISSITAYGTFAQTNNCPVSLAPAATCSIHISFLPNQLGPLTGSVYVATNSTSPVNPSIALSGNGVSGGPALVLGSSGLNFGPETINTSSGNQYVLVRNVSNSPLTIFGESVTLPDYTISGCLQTLAPGSYCYVYVSFKPSVAGVRSGVVTLSDSSPAGSHSFNVSGTGIAIVSTLVFSPSALVMPDTAVGAVSPYHTLVVTNTGDVAISITRVFASGDFNIYSTGCVGTLYPGATCYSYVTFSPTAVGTRTGTLYLEDTAAGSPQQLALSGLGLATARGFNLSPGSLNFGPEPVGSTTSQQGFTVYNDGNVPLTVSVPASVGDYSVNSGCTETVAIGSYCNIYVAFKPTASGARPATLVLTTNAGNANFSLTGSGGTGAATSLFVTTTALTFPSQTVATADSQQYVQIRNTGTNPVTIDSVVLSGAAASDFSISNGCPLSPSTLAAGSACNVYATFTPSAAGLRSAVLTITDNAPGSPETVNLSGTGRAATKGLEADRTTLNFPTLSIGTGSVTQSITLTNTGDSPVGITSVTLTGADYTLSNGCPASLASTPGSNTCLIYVTFVPTAAGTRTGSVTIADNAGNPITIHLSGTGATIVKTLNVSPTGLIFGPQVDGTTSATQIVTVTNTGNAAVTFTNATVTGDFALSNGCTGTLQPAQGCQITVDFTPTTSGTRTGSLTITDNATQTSQAVTLSGTGIPSSSEISLSQSSILFAPQLLNTGSAYQQLYYYNGSSTSITISSVTFGGAAVFTQNHGCDSAVVQPGSYCEIYLQFTPTAAGAFTGTLTIKDNAPGSPRTVALSGIGIASAAPGATVVPSAINFNSQAIGSTSGAYTVTLTNNGSATLNVSKIALGGTNPGDFAISDSCSSVPAGFSCPVSVTFSPTALGARSATLTFSDNAASNPSQVVTLAGTGTPGALPAVTLSPTSLAFPNVAVNASSTQVITVKNTGQSTLTVTGVSVTGTVAADFTETNTCSSVAVNATCTISVTFRPTTTENQTGTVSMADNAPKSPQTVPLTGNGTAASVVFTPSMLAFGTVKVGTTSSSLSVVLENDGDATLTLGSVVSSTTEFPILSKTCGTSLPAGQTCSVTVAFKPAQTGARMGFLVFTDNAGDSPEYVVLTGTGN